MMEWVISLLSLYACMFALSSMIILSYPTLQLYNLNGTEYILSLGNYDLNGFLLLFFTYDHYCNLTKIR